MNKIYSELVSRETIKLLKYNLKIKKFSKIKDCIINNINKEIIQSLKTTKGDTQSKERISISFIKKCLDTLNYSYKEAAEKRENN